MTALCEILRCQPGDLLQ
ncbi:hypothetical protein KSS97_04535 [Pseudomonas alvandae]|uniref:HTH cro/C1-type domain-containing protein n=1 Tax=Pseudomonas canavaninivorans TaxID=2842348 RepID=A0ABX8QL75_PSECO|nr:hypothetical protein KSS97_04535 [Pseudomonas alvandae]